MAENLPKSRSSTLWFILIALAILVVAWVAVSDVGDRSPEATATPTALAPANNLTPAEPTPAGATPTVTLVNRVELEGLPSPTPMPPGPTTTAPAYPSQPTPESYPAPADTPPPTAYPEPGG